MSTDQTLARIEFKRPMSEVDMETFVTEWRRQYAPEQKQQRDDLDDALAAEEHRQGAAYGDDPDHCGDCKREAFLRLQAECEHDGEQADITTLCDADRQLLCQRCGAIREVSR